MSLSFFGKSERVFLLLDGQHTFFQDPEIDYLFLIDSFFLFLIDQFFHLKLMIWKPYIWAKSSTFAKQFMPISRALTEGSPSSRRLK